MTKKTCLKKVSPKFPEKYLKNPQKVYLKLSKKFKSVEMWKTVSFLTFLLNFDFEIGLFIGLVGKGP